MKWKSGKYSTGIREKLIEYSKYAFISVAFLGSIYFIDETIEYARNFIHYELGLHRGSFESDIILMCAALVVCFIGWIIYLYVSPVIKNSKYLFQPKEKRDIIKHIVMICENIKKECQEISKETIGQILRESIKIIKNSKQLEKHAQHRQPPLHIALKAIEHVLYTKITSGQGYVYRGVMGIGVLEEKKAWNYILNKMCSLGYITQEESNEIQKNMNEDIRQVG